MVSAQLNTGPRSSITKYLFLVGLVAIALVSSSCNDDRSIIPDDLSSINEATVEAETGITGVTADDLVTLSGYSTSTEQIVLEAGVLIVRAASEGGLFSVNLVQDGANDLLFNETRKYSGATAIKIREDAGRGISSLQAGPAVLEVISSGNWSLTYTQEEISETHSPSFELDGYQDHVLPAVALEAGTYELTATNDVQFGHFSVELIPRDGDGGLLVANTSSSGEQKFEFEINKADKSLNTPGLYTIVINATGNWKIVLN